MNNKKAKLGAAAQSPAAGSAPFTQNEVRSILLFFVIMALAMTVINSRASMVLIVLAALFTIGKRPLCTLRENLNLASIGFLAFALVNGLAAVFAEFGNLAIGSFYEFLAGFAVAVIFLVTFRKHHVAGILWGLSGVSAFIGILCIDAAVGGPLFSLFRALMAPLGMDYSFVFRVMDGRINGIYNDANVTGGLLAVGTLISLYLMDRAEKPKRRILSALLLGISASAFFLSMSRGAIACFAVALLVWVCTCGKDNWVRILLLMVGAAAVTVVLSVPAMAGIRAQSFLGTLCAAACGPILYVLDRFVGTPLTSALEKHKKAAVISVLALMAAAAVYLVAAVNLTGSHTVLPDEIFRRAVSLQPGSYTVSGDWDGNPTAAIRVRASEEIVLNRWNDVYNGPLSEASFEVPEDTAQIQVQLYTDEPVELRTVEFSDGTRLKLGYPLLPVFVADRIQDGLLTGTNVVQRVQFVKDALKIFAGKPILGHGLGSTEALYTSVQPFFYETLYVHNHLVQVMCDMGLVGLAAFLLFLLGSLLPLVAQLRTRRDPLAATLLACWVMINTHSFIEINFSVRGYQIFIFPVLLLPALLYAKPMKEKFLKVGGMAAAGFIWLYVLIFGGVVESHRMVERDYRSFTPSSVTHFMSSQDHFAKFDIFERDRYRLNYIANAVAKGDALYLPTAQEYVSRLRTRDNYTNCVYLAKYYYLPTGDLEEMFNCSRQGIAQEASNPDAWNDQFQFYREDVLSALTADRVETFISGVLGTVSYLEQYSQDHWEDIVLTQENQDFLSRIALVQEQGLTGPDALKALTTAP